MPGTFWMFYTEGLLYRQIRLGLSRGFTAKVEMPFQILLTV